MTSFSEDVREGLQSSPKTLSCRFLYDARGSQLFDKICELPEYYPTRTERSILQRSAHSIAESFPQCRTIVELGSGSATKTRVILDAFTQRRPRLRYVPIDISEEPVVESSRQLLDDYPELAIVGVAAEYQEGLRQMREHSSSPRLLLWLGSSIGNFDPPTATAFLRRLASNVGPEDRFLIGMDLRKDARTLEKAYDDSQGVTAEFNLNLLRRINRELHGNFRIDRFAHQAIYNDERGRVEMHLRSLQNQQVDVADLQIQANFREGETIHTENSYKFSQEQIESIGQEAGLTLARQWFDPERRFSLNLFSKCR